MSLKQSSFTCHVSFLAAPDTDNKHKSHLPHLSFRQHHQHTQGLWYSIHVHTAKVQCRVADQHKSHLSEVCEPKLIETEAIEPEDLDPRRIELERNLGTLPYLIQERFTEQFPKSCHRRCGMMQETFKKWNQITARDCLTFPVNLQ